MTHQTHDHASKKKLCVDVSESFGLTIGTVAIIEEAIQKISPTTFGILMETKQQFKGAI